MNCYSRSRRYLGVKFRFPDFWSSVYFFFLIGNSPVVLWLGLDTFSTKDPDSVPGPGGKIPQVTWCGQKKK